MLRNGTLYNGHFNMDTMWGYGTTTKLSGDRHTGYYCKGVRHGQGQSYKPSLKRYYSGSYLNGKEEGFCTITRTLKEGGGTRQYMWYVSGGSRHGQGQQIETTATGQIIVFEGLWFNDQLSGQGRLTLPQPGGRTDVMRGIS